ncbi:hypothetical protein [Pseudonocardia alni]|nr:hypothetical protein [Pseudonocardia alni]
MVHARAEAAAGGEVDGGVGADEDVDTGRVEGRHAGERVVVRRVPAGQ